MNTFSASLSKFRSADDYPAAGDGDFCLGEFESVAVAAAAGYFQSLARGV